MKRVFYCFFFFSSRRRHTRLQGDWSSDVCSSDLVGEAATQELTELAGSNGSRTPGLNPYPATKAKLFLRMAWLANPFAYVSLNTLIALTPGVAKRLGLSTMLAGFCCSVWCFARLGAFIALWFWGGWHYRFRWLLAAYVTLVAAFAAMLMVPNLVVLLVAQVGF